MSGTPLRVVGARTREGAQSWAVLSLGMLLALYALDIFRAGEQTRDEAVQDLLKQGTAYVVALSPFAQNVMGPMAGAGSAQVLLGVVSFYFYKLLNLRAPQLSGNLVLKAFSPEQPRTWLAYTTPVLVALLVSQLEAAAPRSWVRRLRYPRAGRYLADEFQPVQNAPDPDPKIERAKQANAALVQGMRPSSGTFLKLLDTYARDYQRAVDAQKVLADTLRELDASSQDARLRLLNLAMQAALGQAAALRGGEIQPLVAAGVVAVQIAPQLELVSSAGRFLELLRRSGEAPPSQADGRILLERALNTLDVSLEDYLETLNKCASDMVIADPTMRAKFLEAKRANAGRALYQKLVVMPFVSPAPAPAAPAAPAALRGRGPSRELAALQAPGQRGPVAARTRARSSSRGPR